MNTTSYRTFGSYRLVHPLGSSIRAFRALHQDTGEPCVVKIFHGCKVSPEVWGDIGRTLRGFPSRRDPVCAIQEVGLLHGEVYAVAPYLDGENLSKLVKAVTLHKEITTTPQHHRVCAFIIAELARGLALRGSESFQHPIFGPDMISPDDLFVLFDGSVRVLDPAWTWLRAVTTGSPWSSIEHNLAYMLPEDMRPAEKRDAGRVWALGVLLWELLVGYRLFRRYEVKSTLYAVNRRRVPDPRSLNPNVPKSLAELSMRLLSKPGIASLGELRGALERESGYRPGEAPEAVNAWLGRLVALRRESGHLRVHKAVRTVDTILDDAKGPWPETEASTTCIIAPPALDSEGPLELSWLEDDPTPRVRPLAESSPRARRSLKLLGLLVVVVLGTGLSIVPANKQEAAWASAVGDTWSRGGVTIALPPSAPRATAGVAQESWGALADLAHEEKDVAAHFQRLLERELTAFQPPGPLQHPTAAKASPLAKAPPPTPSSTEKPAPSTVERTPKNLPTTTNGDMETPSSLERSEPVAPTGDLLVRTEEDTKVLLNDRLLGSGVFSVRLPPGQHRLSFHAPGQPPSHIVAHVRAGVSSIVSDD